MKNLTSNHKKYLSKNPLKRYMLNRFEQKTITLLSPLITENTHILDAGCGEGFVSNNIYNHFNNIKITGIDNNPSALSVASKSNPNIEFVNRDIYQTNFATNSFDIVLCLEVLEDLENPLAALHELLRISKNKIVISVPNEPFFSIGNLLSFKNISRLGNDADHINTWTHRGFLKWLKENGIKTTTATSSFPWTIVICEK